MVLSYFTGRLYALDSCKTSKLQKDAEKVRKGNLILSPNVAVIEAVPFSFLNFSFFVIKYLAQSVVAAEYTDCISAEG